MRNTINNVASFLFCLACVAIVVSLSGCSAVQQTFNETPYNSKRSSDLGNVELYTYELAQELFFNMTPDRQYRYAVTGFVPVTTLKAAVEEQSPIMLLGHQLEQGLTTETVRRGYIAQDYKSTNSIIMEAQSERSLSRNLDHLTGTQNIDFFITGTITEQESGAIVNARIINARTKDVIAAATKFFPSELFWQTESVTTRNGMLYRKTQPTRASERTGER